MAHVKKSSRSLFLGAAFVGVMAATGALFGFIGGLMLVLLSHAVLRADGGMVPLMITSGAVGVAAATLWSIILVAGRSRRNFAWQNTSRAHSNAETN
jgi:hypothetical protein